MAAQTAAQVNIPGVDEDAHGALTNLCLALFGIGNLSGLRLVPGGVTASYGYVGDDDITGMLTEMGLLPFNSDAELLQHRRWQRELWLRWPTLLQKICRALAPLGCHHDSPAIYLGLALTLAPGLRILEVTPDTQPIFAGIPHFLRGYAFLHTGTIYDDERNPHRHFRETLKFFLSISSMRKLTLHGVDFAAEDIPTLFEGSNVTTLVLHNCNISSMQVLETLMRLMPCLQLFFFVHGWDLREADEPQLGERLTPLDCDEEAVLRTLARCAPGVTVDIRVPTEEYMGGLGDLG